MLRLNLKITLTIYGVVSHCIKRDFCGIKRLSNKIVNKYWKYSILRLAKKIMSNWEVWLFAVTESRYRCVAPTLAEKLFVDFQIMCREGRCSDCKFSKGRKLLANFLAFILYCSINFRMTHNQYFILMDNHYNIKNVLNNEHYKNSSFFFECHDNC